MRSEILFAIVVVAPFVSIALRRYYRAKHKQAITLALRPLMAKRSLYKETIAEMLRLQEENHFFLNGEEIDIRRGDWWQIVCLPRFILPSISFDLQSKGFSYQEAHKLVWKKLKQGTMSGAAIYLPYGQEWTHLKKSA